MPSLEIVLLHCLLAILEFIRNAAASFPLIAAIGLCAGRRDHGREYLDAAARFFKIFMGCSILGFLYFPLAYFILLLPYKTATSTLWGPLLEPAGLPWSASMAAWMGGIICFSLAWQALPGGNGPNSYGLAYVRNTLIFCCIAGLFFFATFILINWPFAGLPENLAFDRAVMAIIRNASRNYFMTFGASGALALFFASGICRMDLLPRIPRWLAVWAVLGYLPSLLQRWSVILGIFVNKSIPGGTSGYQILITQLAFLTLAIICWSFTAITGKWPGLAANFGMGLLAANILLPPLSVLLRSL